MKTKFYFFIIGLFLLIQSTQLNAQSTCLVPTGLANSLVTSTSATVTWLSNTSGSYYKIQYHPAGMNPIVWTQFYAQTNTYTLSGLTCGTTYEWQVQSICANSGGVASTSAFSSGISFTTLPCNTTCAVPTGMTTSSINTTNAVASWTSVSGALAYVIQYHPVNSGTTNWVQATVTGTTYTFTNLLCGTNYEWQVQSLCSTTPGGSSPFSAGTLFSTPACTATCPVPTALTSSNITTTNAMLSWTSTSPAPAYYLVQYHAVNTSAWTSVTVASNQSVALSSLTCNTTYEWKVQCICGNSGTSTSSPFSAVVSFTTSPCPVNCGTPSGLTTSTITTSSAMLAWTAPSGAIYYNLQYRPLAPANSNWFTQTITSGTTFTLPNLLCGTAYEWQVQSVCGASGAITTTSPFSASSTFTTLPCTITCPVPIGLNNSNITSTSATLSWTSATPAPYYILQYTVVGSGVWTSVNIAANQTYVLTGLTCNTAYEWKVKSVCTNSGTSGTSALSAALNFTTLPCANVCATPTAPITTSVSATSAVLSWTATAGVSVYNLQYKQSNVGAGWTQTTVQGTSFTVSNLLCNTQYEWQVAAVCSTLGGTTTLSAYTAGVVFTTAACATTCPVPTGMISANITANSAYLGWTAMSGVIGYRIQYRAILANVPPTNPWIQQTLQANTVLLSNLLCNTLYEWQVQSICSTTAGGTSVFTSSITFTTAACPVNCLAPVGLFATNITPSSALLKWTAAAATGVFSIRYRKLNTSNWAYASSTVNSKVISGLAIQSYYEWQVQVLCPGSSGTSGNWSPWSSSSYFHTHFVVSATPNPADRILKVEVKMELEEAGAVKVELRNILGAVVYSSEEKFEAGINQFEIATANLKEGVYFLSLSGDAGNEVTKVYVKH